MVRKMTSERLKQEGRELIKQLGEMAEIIDDMKKYDKRFIIGYIINKQARLEAVVDLYASACSVYPTQEEIDELVKLYKKYKKEIIL